jgi:DNA-binding CsgD family transcriptional regulator
MTAILNACNASLTEREKQILAHIADGLSSKQIADKLAISINTVGNHRKNMLLKMGAKNTAELIQRSLIRHYEPII